jgi:uncharacterized membrane protein
MVAEPKAPPSVTFEPSPEPSPRRWLRRVKLVALLLMAAFYIWAGTSHFTRQEFFLSLMPPYIPFHGAMVALSGLCEIAFGVLVLIPRTRSFAAWSIILMLIAFLPVHVHMLVNNHLYP